MIYNFIQLILPLSANKNDFSKSVHVIPHNWTGGLIINFIKTSNQRSPGQVSVGSQLFLATHGVSQYNVFLLRGKYYR